MTDKFGQSEMNEIPSGWEECIFSEAVDVNPKRELKKGSTAKFVSMAELREFNKKIQGFTVRQFSGGSKFVNGNTLMARITPCLENRKTAFVDILKSDEVGCGSTEFIVLGGKDNKSTDQFVYYLAISPMIRQAAIKSMTGTSGRQRVESGVFDKLIINLPEIVEQRAIAKVLSDLDEKIELNNQMNKTLEAMGQALFKRWFVDFEFPGHEKTKLVKGIPDGWHQGALGEICTIESGKRPEAKSDSRTEECAVPLIGASSVMGYVKTLLYNEPILIIGRVGTHGVVQRVLPPSFPSDNTLVIRPKYYEYIYQVLKTIDYDSLNVGTTQPLITQTAVKKHDTLIPSDNILEKFETAISPLFIKVAANNQESDVLAGIRDSLLPKLMSGKIRMVQ